MPLNAQAEMGRVLAIEPEASQADALRQFVRDELGAELMLVSSAYAAVVAINRQTPDVVLFSESVSEKHRDRVLDHLRSTIAPAVPQRLTLPSLRHCDRAALAQQIQTLVARAQDARPRSASAPAAAAPAGTARPAAAPTPVPRRRGRSRSTRVRAADLDLSTTSAPGAESPRSTSSPTICRSIRCRVEIDNDDALDEAVASLNAEERGRRAAHLDRSHRADPDAASGAPRPTMPSMPKCTPRRSRSCRRWPTPSSPPSSIACAPRPPSSASPSWRAIENESAAAS